MKSISIVNALLFSFFGSLLFSQNDSPKLMVGIVVDQMCYEYLYRFRDHYTEGGFKRLMNEGTNCRTTHYNYVPTYTGPGHASIYTGTTPSNHGIVANDWLDRVANSTVNCVEDQTVQTVGSDSKKGMFSPARLKVNTITDQLKLERPASKVIAMSIKNRGAILPGGHLSDGTYWFDSKSGDFITSTFYKQELPQWVADFNKKNLPEKSMKQVWNTFFPIERYVESGPDNSPYEHLLPGKTEPVFPYDLSKMSTKETVYDLFTCTPFANTFLTDFAIQALHAEKMGQNGATDMLCISYSSTDIIGHEFGPQSKEIQDTYIRLDRELERLLNELDNTLGKGNYTLFLTADHAVVPVPQLLVDKKLAGGYVFLSEAVKQLKTDVTDTFGADLIVAEENLNIYLDRTLIRERGLKYDEVCRFVKEHIREWKGVKNVYTSGELQTGSGDKWFEMIRSGYHYKESGDVIFSLESGHLPKSKDTDKARKGTSHGSPYAYDTQVPLLFFGHSVPQQEVFRVVEITDIAPTIAHILDISFSHAATGKPIVELFQK
ncbi:alkaline phosphatase family protein [Crocinitomicaceae bacterium CZZ-1]|uniref:Alkaline phosphatase family protein n=1 Tax=Taishania pollutisoli TaxID=2766479 RepID=A0A8J6PFY2_9FLAO|nr:alkaline phosphatase PafA [Taishania pollutisoli]MBC9813760.1 alkaline phosphatase family protein [Taishania pollutisoli]MBX2950728.1 alkaline phosphatase family protein [Crocinitomicaceae bacterium]